MIASGRKGAIGRWQFIDIVYGQSIYLQLRLQYVTVYNINATVGHTRSCCVDLKRVTKRHETLYTIATTEQRTNTAKMTINHS